MNDKAPPVSGASSADGDGPPAAPKPAPEAASFPAPPRVRTNLTLDEVGPLWDSFRMGGVVPCPCAFGSLALSVDGNNSYRLVCTRCGTASSWFEAAPAGIRLRTVPPGPDDEAADI
jgi:hypothetical protein